LNLLAAAALKVRRAGGQVVLVGCSPALRRVVAYRGWRRLFRLERAAPE
jgi:anti-anti-sigma regulatory factor